MKCAACGYDTDLIPLATVHREFYRSGTKKGQIKEELVIPNKDYKPFFRIKGVGGTELTRLCGDNENDYYYYNNGVRDQEIYACPKCGTLKMEIY